MKLLGPIFLLVLANAVSGQTITWVNDMNGYDISEDVSIGSLVYVLRARSTSGEVEYSIASDYFELKDSKSGEMYLTRQLDFEDPNQRQISLDVSAFSGTSNLNTRTVTVDIIDANDAYPIFGDRSDIYSTTISENQGVGSTVFSNVAVTDVDGVNGVLTVACIDPGTEPNPCEIFGVIDKYASSNEWSGDIVLYKPLDYETATKYQLQLSAFDGVNTQRKSFTINVQDESDLPPVFQGSLTVIIPEDLGRGEEVLQVTATDGDQGANREIRYSLTTNAGNYFTIDEITGMITTARKLSTDDPILSEGYMYINVKAAEVIRPGVIGNDPTTTTEARITITIADKNDHAPTFTPQTYTASLEEESTKGTALLGLSMTVTDKDQGSNADFELSLLNFNDIFEVQPTFGSKSVIAGLVVKNGDLLDYENGQHEYKVRVLAQETRTAERRTGEAIVTIKITDINDNAPVFADTAYDAKVAEGALPGTSIITITATDADSGFNGQEGIRYRLTGNGANKFRTNRYTGEVMVAECATPGSGNCLDYEQQKVYVVNFEAWDKFGEDKMSSVKLTIRLTDNNDNPPTFALDEYVRYIDEGQTVPNPELKVQAKDADTGTVITYRIVNGNPNIGNGQNLWQIGEKTGIISATRPVEYGDTIGDTGVFLLTVEASDGSKQVTTQAKIYVNDINNHAPVFPVDMYEQTIPESTPPGTSVEQVTATDADSQLSPNGKVQYRIGSGSGDKFVIDKDTGIISVAPDVAFDADDQRNYTMIVIADDQGAPQFSSSATVLINIRDINNKLPYFPSTITRTDVYEDESIGAEVITMSAIDSDSGADLKYTFIGPISAQDDNGNEVNGANRYDDLFLIDKVNGVVRVNQNMDRDKVATWTSVVEVEDIAGGGDQTATGTLIINIRERNGGPPDFENGWTPDDPYIRLNLNEEDPVGTLVTVLQASDPTDAIQRFQLTSNPKGYLSVDSNTGVLQIARPIDYETDQQFEAVVIVVDNGQPSMTSTATILVDVNNLNDNSPVFSQPWYETNIPENSPGGTYVVKISATDLDLGDFGTVRYSLTDPLNRFNIDPVSGLVTVADGVVLDRESTPQISISAVAYDSPNNVTYRRSTAVPIIINLDDTNDHVPTFNPDQYYATLVENEPIDTSVVRVTGRDGDEGENAELIYFILSGNINGNFRVNQTTGVIYTDKSLDGSAGVFNLTLGVKDKGAATAEMDTASVLITVLEANNGAPIWITPNSNNDSFTFLENQYAGVEIVTVKAIDNDTGSNGIVTYGFKVDGEFVSETDDFKINPFSGVITAKRVFDRETKDAYTLEVAARDSGNPVMESTRFITLRVGDVGDNQPEFPTDSKCCPERVSVSVDENTDVGTSVGDFTASDPDLGDNGKVIYSIAPPGSPFTIDPDTGNVTLTKDLDYDEATRYRLVITAKNPIPSGSYDIDSTCRCNNQSSMELDIRITRNNFVPTFAENKFNTCVPIDAEVGKYVYTMRASDPRSGSTKNITYSITSLLNPLTRKEDDLFVIGPSNGSVYTNTPMGPFKDLFFDLFVKASVSVGDLFSQAHLLVWVTEASDEVKLTLGKNLEQVEAQIEQLKKAISEKANWGAVCVADIRYHVTEGGNVDIDKTDLFLYVVDGGSKRVLTPDEVRALLGEEFMRTLGIESISEAYALWDGFDIDPVLWAIIAIILLLLLGLLLLCCLWWCCAHCLEDEEEEQLIYDPVVTAETVNPLWKQKLYEDQELRMAVPDQDDIEPKGFTIHGTYDNSAFDASDEKDDVLGQTLTDGTARLTIPGNEITKETREETEFHMTSFTEAMPFVPNGTIGGQRTLLNATSVDAIDAPLADSRPPTRHAMTMTETGVQYERTPMGAYEATVIGYQEPVRMARVGATLTRPTTPHAASMHAYSAYNGEMDLLPLNNLNDPLVAYDYDDGPRLNQGVQTGPLDDYPLGGNLHTYSASIPEDRRTELSLSPSQLANSWVDEPLDGLYQGEIHLGTIKPPSVGGPPAYHMMDDGRFVEYTYEDGGDLLDTYPKY